MEFLADDGVIFQPGPVNGKEFWRQRPPSKSFLSWRPIYADVSAAGDFGYTTGPYEFRPNGRNSDPSGFGQYFTIWKRQEDGAWKAVLDRGISYTTPSESNAQLRFGSPMPTRDHIIRDKTAILKAESDFAAIASKDIRAAVARYFANDIIALRNDSFPVTNKAAASAIATSAVQALTWHPIAADIARSGDLGYSYGTYELKHFGPANLSEVGIYVRMWKRQANGEFRAVIDILVPNSEK